MDLPILIVKHQSGPVAIAVESKLRAAGTLKLDGSQHCRPIILIGGVASVNKEYSIVLLLGVLLPQ